MRNRSKGRVAVVPPSNDLSECGRGQGLMSQLVGLAVSASRCVVAAHSVAWASVSAFPGANLRFV